MYDDDEQVPTKAPLKPYFDPALPTSYTASGALKIQQCGLGRLRGAKNKVPAEVKAYAQDYSFEAIDQLVDLMRNGKAEITRLAAANMLLDRSVGKPTRNVNASDPDEIQTIEIVHRSPYDPSLDS